MLNGEAENGEYLMARSLQQLLGKHVLASLTELDASGRILRRNEFHGTLIFEKGKPACLRADTQRPLELPDNLDYYFPVDPELEYELQETGETVTGIDYTLTFVKAPPEYFQ
jgi:hypothetical protein